MRMHMPHVVSALAFSAILATATAASAQRVVVEERGGDYTRLRAGIDLTGGAILDGGVGVGLIGLDGRLGVQLNNLFAIYGQAHFVFGGGTVPAPVDTGLTEVFSLSAVADFTFNRVFVGFGGGVSYVGYYADAGPEAILRIGFYPIERWHRWGRRSGLMIGGDLHIDYVPHGGGAAYVEPMFLIGYEAF